MLSLALVALMLSSGAAMGQESPVDGAPDTAPGEDIDYTREQIVVERDDAEGTVKLKLGESAMYVDYGDGRISFTAVQTRYLGIADVYHQRQGFDKRVGIPAQTIVFQRLIGIIEYTDDIIHEVKKSVAPILKTVLDDARQRWQSQRKALKDLS